MFSWFKNKPRLPQQPPVHPAPPPPARSPRMKTKEEEPYPRMGTKIRVGFANGQRSWEESADLVQVLERVLNENGHATAPHDDGVLHKASGILLQPNFCGLEPHDPSGASTATIVEASHPSFGKAKVFEYQHSRGENIEKSLADGFFQWMQLDLPVLVEALGSELNICMAMQMRFKDQPLKARRAVLGPIAHFRQHQPPPGACVLGPDGQPHDFCPCCFLTNSMNAFKAMLESDGFFAIRFFASNDGQRAPQADCRVNGEDYEPGKLALLKYVEKWPQSGFEFRKQYVVFQNVKPDEPFSTEGGP